MYSTVLEKLGTSYDPSKIRGAFVCVGLRSLFLTKALLIYLRWTVRSDDDGVINKRRESFSDILYCII